MLTSLHQRAMRTTTGQPGMWKFYRAILQRPGHVLWYALRTGNGFVGVTITLLMVFNRPLGEYVKGYQGFSPWWGLLPSALLLVHAIIAGAYERYCDVTRERDAVAGERDLALKNHQECRACIEEMAKAHAATVRGMAKSEGPAPERGNKLLNEHIRKLIEYRMSVEHLLDNPKAHSEWVKEAERLVGSVDFFIVSGHLPQPIKTMLRVPSTPTNRKAEPKMLTVKAYNELIKLESGLVGALDILEAQRGS